MQPAALLVHCPPCECRQSSCTAVDLGHEVENHGQRPLTSSTFSTAMPADLLARFTFAGCETEALSSDADVAFIPGHWDSCFTWALEVKSHESMGSSESPAADQLTDNISQPAPSSFLDLPPEVQQLVVSHCSGHTRVSLFIASHSTRRLVLSTVRSVKLTPQRGCQQALLPCLADNHEPGGFSYFSVRLKDGLWQHLARLPALQDGRIKHLRLERVGAADRRLEVGTPVSLGVQQLALHRSTIDLLQDLLATCPDVVSIELSDCSQLSAEAQALLLDTARFLEISLINGHPSLVTASENSLSAWAPRLRAVEYTPMGPHGSVWLSEVLLGSGHTCPRLRHITLPQAKITWEQLEALLKVAPCLESLYVFRLTPPKPSLTSSSSTSSLIRLRAGASAHREHVVERKENTAGEGGCQRLGVLHSLVVVMLHLEDLIRMPEAFTQVPELRVVTSVVFPNVHSRSGLDTLQRIDRVLSKMQCLKGGTPQDRSCLELLPIHEPGLLEDKEGVLLLRGLSSVMLSGDLLLLVYARSLLQALTKHVPALGIQLDDLKEGSAVSVLTACQDRVQVLRIKAAPACLEPLLSVLPTITAILPRLRKIVLVCGVYFPDLFAGQQGPEAAPQGMPDHLLQAVDVLAHLCCNGQRHIELQLFGVGGGVEAKVRQKCEAAGGGWLTMAAADDDT